MLNRRGFFIGGRNFHYNPINDGALLNGGGVEFWKNLQVSSNSYIAFVNHMSINIMHMPL